MHFIVSGFDAFGTDEVNPSQLAIERLEGLVRSARSSEHSWVFHVLRTCCDDAWSALQARVAGVPEGEPFVVVMTGLAANRNRICLERFALNVRSYRIIDNRGHQWQEEYIDPAAPDAMRCKTDLLGLASAMNQNGFASDVSNYAGSFVCNETYFRAMQKWHPNRLCKGILFVHFPRPVDYVGTNPDQAVPRDVDELERISQEALEHYAQATLFISAWLAKKDSEAMAV